MLPLSNPKAPVSTLFKGKNPPFNFEKPIRLTTRFYYVNN